MALRDKILAYSQVHSCSGSDAKRLLIRFPVVTVEQLNPTHENLDLFDAAEYDASDTVNYVYLRLYPDYTVENDRLGEKGLRNTFGSSAVFAPANTRRGFKVTIKDRRKLILDLMRQLVALSESASYNRYAPIKIIDFCHPELPNDSKTNLINGELATIRWGAIEIDTNLPSIVTIKANDYLRNDWGFSFKECFLRLA